MNAKITRRLIDHVGGPKAFAKTLGLDYTEQGQAQRINNWRTRGLPARVILNNYQLLQRLRRQAGM